MLVGGKESKPLMESSVMEVGLLNIAPGKTFPQHARDAKEICYILSGSPLLGATEQHLKKVDPGDFVFYENAAPRVFMVRAENISQMSKCLIVFSQYKFMHICRIYM